MEKKETFSSRLVRLRGEAGLKRQELADKLGCSRAALEYWEKGQRTPDIYMVTQIADFFRVPTDWLVRGVSPYGLEYFRETGLNDDATATLADQKESAEVGSDKAEDFNALLNGILSSGGFYGLLWRILRLQEELPPLIEQIMELEKQKNAANLADEMRLDKELLPLREKRDFLEWQFIRQVEAFYRRHIPTENKEE